jgi:DNA polymerase IV (DinB-like DNA polymerase)
MARIILHVDMDSFYASVEELRNPDLKGKAIVTCMFSGRTKDSGAVSASNYKARELGIRSGMPIRVAKSLAKGKDVAFLPSDREYYWEVSGRVMQILKEHADSFEQVSVDEAYLDVTRKSQGSWERAQKIAQSIKEEILERESLSCSIGIGPNKLVAKMASKAKKPDGLTAVRPAEVTCFLERIPLSKLHGIGEKTAEELGGIGIKSIKDLAQADLGKLQEAFGQKRGRILQEKARGIDESPVEEREAKQISRLATLKKDSSDTKDIMGKLEELSEDVDRELKEAGLHYRTISIILIDTHLQMQTRSRSTIESPSLRKNLDIAKELLQKFLKENQATKLRRVGIRVAGFSQRKQKTLGDFPKP